VDDTRPIEDVVKDVTGNETSCKDLELDEPRIWKVATVAEFYETRYAVKPVVVKWGCIDMVIWLPGFETKKSEIVLYGYVSLLKNASTDIWDMVEKCFWDSVQSSAVVGIVLMSFEAAAETFRALMNECVKAKLGHVLACMAPGLMLQTHTLEDWH
jgi:hypothetical protein